MIVAIVRAEGAARGRQVKVKSKLSEPNSRLEAEADFDDGEQRNSRIPFGQKKKKRRY